MLQGDLCENCSFYSNRAMHQWNATLRLPLLKILESTSVRKLRYAYPIRKGGKPSNDGSEQSVHHDVQSTQLLEKLLDSAGAEAPALVRLNIGVGRPGMHL